MKEYKRPNECFYPGCTSRCCHEHVYTKDNGETFNEIACVKHVMDLYKYSDEVAPGVPKIFSSSTGKQDRRSVKKDIEEWEEFIKEESE